MNARQADGRPASKIYPSQFNPQHERARLQEQRAWLEHRRALARRESWDHGMVARIESDLETTARELDELAPR